MISGLLSRPLLHHLADKDCVPLYTDTSSYTVPLTYTKFGERAFSVAGPSVWNSLPADIRHITDISKFKRHLKTYLLTSILILSRVFVFIRFSGFRLYIELCNTPVDSFCN